MVKKQQTSQWLFQTLWFYHLVHNQSYNHEHFETVSKTQPVNSHSICCLDQHSASLVIWQDYSDPTNPHTLAAQSSLAEGGLQDLYLFYLGLSWRIKRHGEFDMWCLYLALSTTAGCTHSGIAAKEVCTSASWLHQQQPVFFFSPIWNRSSVLLCKHWNLGQLTSCMTTECNICPEL